MPTPSTQALVALVGVTESGLDDFRADWASLNARRQTSGVLDVTVKGFEFNAVGLKDLSGQLFKCMAVALMPTLPTWSRLPHLNRWGPSPLRTAASPWGLPNLNDSCAERVNAENGLYQQVLKLIEEIIQQNKENGTEMKVILIHPEDLGAVHGRRPASPWQLDELQSLARSGKLERGAMHQCRLGQLRQAQATGFLTNARPADRTYNMGWPKLDHEGNYQGPLRKSCGCGRRHRSGLRTGTAFKTPQPALSRGGITWLAELLHHAGSRSWLKLGLPEDRERDIAELLPDFINYDWDSDGYDTEGTVFHDPLSHEQSEHSRSNIIHSAGAGAGDLNEFIGKHGFKNTSEVENFGSKVLVRRIPLRLGASNGRWKEDANKHRWARHFNSCFAGGKPNGDWGSREPHLPAVTGTSGGWTTTTHKPPTRRTAGRVATNDGRGRTGSAPAALGP